ncbi:MAG: PAS domain-containing protein [Alphaproteobacteria bacterium]
MRYITSLDEAFEVITSDEQSRACVITDPRRPDNPIVYVTPEFERQTGYEKAEVLGRNTRFLFGPQTDQAAVAAIEDAFANMTPLEIEILNYCKDGTPFWNDMSIRPVFSDNGALKSFVTVQSTRPASGVSAMTVVAA